MSLITWDHKYNPHLESYIKKINTTYIAAQESMNVLCIKTVRIDSTESNGLK